MIPLYLNVYVVIQKPSISAAYKSALTVAQNELPPGVKAGKEVFDYAERSWVTDTGIMQFTMSATAGGSSNWKCLYDAATQFVERIHKDIGRSLFGATFVLPVVGDDAAKQAREFIAEELGISRPIMQDSHEGVTVELYQKSDFRDEYGKSLVLAHSQQILTSDETHLWLAGIDSYLMQPEILAHKVSWISRQVLSEPKHTDLKAEMTTILGMVRVTAELLKTGDIGDVILQSPHSQLRYANLVAVLVATITDLLPQVDHLKYFTTHGPLKTICAGYVQNAENILGQVKSLHSELLQCSKSLSEILSAAQLYVEFIHADVARERELRSLRAERWIASLGVGIGSAEIVSDEFAKGLASLSGQDAWWPVFLIRSVIVVLLSGGMYFLWGIQTSPKKATVRDKAVNKIRSSIFVK